MDPVSRLAGELERRAFGAVFLAELGRWLTGLSFAVGAAILVARVAQQGQDLAPALLQLLFLSFALAPLAAFARARRRRVPRAAAVAWLDVRAGSSGALVTELEAPDARWSPRLSEVLARVPALPRVRVARPLALPLLGALFVWAALAVEVPAQTPGPSPALFEAALERVEEKLTTLEEEVELEEELGRELNERLERLEQDLAGASPESTYEAIDRLEQRLEDEAQRVRDAAERANEALAGAAFAAGFDGGLALEKLGDALAELAERGLGASLSEQLRQELAELEGLDAEERVGLDPAQMLELSEELRALLQSKLDGLATAGLTRPLRLLEPGEFASLEGFEFADHECDEECKPGGL